MRLRHSLPILLVTLTVVTLSAAPKKTPPRPADYFPLRVGDSWTYRNDTGETEFSQKIISEEKQADGSVRYLLERLAGAKVLTWFSKTGGWVLMHKESYPEHEGLEATYEPPKQHLQNPLEKGFKWTWSGKDYTQVATEESYEVIGFDNVSVVAGKFRAMKVVSHIKGSGALVRTTWYADGVGLVKSTTEGGQIKYGFELIDYSFKNKPKR